MANKKQQDERTLQFKKHFIEKRASGHKIPEIADMYKISHRHAYNLLQEIADENGVTRDELLYHPHSLHAKPLFLHRNGEEKVNIEEVRKDFQNILTSAKNVMNVIETLLEEDEQ